MTRPDAADDRLAALFAADLPPARDPVFQAGVLEALARRRFLIDLAFLSAACAVSVVVIWAVWPAIARTVEALAQQLAPGAIAVTAAASVVAIATSRVLAPRS